MFFKKKLTEAKAATFECELIVAHHKDGWPSVRKILKESGAPAFEDDDVAQAYFLIAVTSLECQALGNVFDSDQTERFLARMRGPSRSLAAGP